MIMMPGLFFSLVIDQGPAMHSNCAIVQVTGELPHGCLSSLAAHTWYLTQCHQSASPPVCIQPGDEGGGGGWGRLSRSTLTSRKRCPGPHISEHILRITIKQI